LRLTRGVICQLVMLQQKQVLPLIVVGLVFSTAITTEQKARNGINWRNRNYARNPITVRESNYIKFRDDSGISAAVCHRTLFGNLTLDPIFAFVSYYRLIGFDHIFFWYRKEITALHRFQELRNLPYVTMTQYNGGGREHGQEVVHRLCLQKSIYAASYDWAFIIDIDEFLWLKEKQSIKSFILHYQKLKTTYISFGKWMYTLKHSTKLLALDSGFGLDAYPYTAKSYCLFNNGTAKRFSMGSSYCPTWEGRSKTLVKVKNYPISKTGFRIHGNPMMVRNSIHLDVNEAHLKEWCHLMSGSHAGESIIRNDTRFAVPNETFVETHTPMQSHVRDKDGKLYFYFDNTLQEWMTYVAQGCPLSLANEEHEDNSIEAMDHINRTVLDSGRHAEDIGDLSPAMIPTKGYTDDIMLVVQGIEFVVVMSSLLFWLKLRSKILRFQN